MIVIHSGFFSLHKNFQYKAPKQLPYENSRKCENSMCENNKNLEILWATQSIYCCQILCNTKKYMKFLYWHANVSVNQVHQIKLYQVDLATGGIEITTVVVKGLWYR